MVSNNQPNPHRVAAGRLNRQKRGPLTEAGRQRLRAAALRDQPWLKSKPRAGEGQHRAAQNGQKGREGSLSIRQARSVLKDVRSLIRTAADITKIIATGF